MPVPCPRPSAIRLAIDSGVDRILYRAIISFCLSRSYRALEIVWTLGGLVRILVVQTQQHLSTGRGGSKNEMRSVLLVRHQARVVLIEVRLRTKAAASIYFAVSSFSSSGFLSTANTFSTCSLELTEPRRLRS